MKILFLAANPKGTKHLGLDEEIREITQKVNAAKHRASIEIVQAWAVTPDDLLQALNQHQPHVVHFSGHGNLSGQIVLNDEKGNSKAVSKEAISALFRTLKDNVQVVLLNACFSQSQAEGIIENIPCAIGMSRAIGDNAAIAFAGSFYRALGFGRSVQDAFDQGVTALMLEGIPEEKTPKLLVKAGIDAADCVLVNPQMPL
jgi:CHAT domain-containing protein